MRRLELAVSVLVEAEDHRGAFDDDRPSDEVRILHHEIDRLFFRSRQLLFLEDRTARADVLEKAIGIDVLSRNSRVGGSRLMSTSCTSTPVVSRKLLAFLQVVQVGFQ